MAAIIRTSEHVESVSLAGPATPVASARGRRAARLADLSALAELWPALSRERRAGRRRPARRAPGDRAGGPPRHGVAVPVDAADRAADFRPGHGERGRAGAAAARRTARPRLPGA